MQYLPIFLQVRQRWVLLVGAGEVALRKAQLLKQAGACIRLVAPEKNAAFDALLTPEDRYVPRVFAPEDLDGVELVIAATSDEAVNRSIYALASARKLPVNVVDCPALCSRTTSPTMISVGGLISVSLTISAMVSRVPVSTR